MSFAAVSLPAASAKRSQHQSRAADLTNAFSSVVSIAALIGMWLAASTG